jgi:hypothetical protein
MRNSLTSIKKLSLALGVAGIGALVGLPALAQSSPDSSGTAPEFELSKEGYAILCERTPLNSRCEGSPYYTGSSSQSPTEDPAASPSDTTVPEDGSSPDSGTMESPSDTTPSDTTAPTEDLPSESDPSAPDQAPSGTLEDGSSPGSDGSTTSPDDTTAPTQPLPSEPDGQ